MQTQARRPHGRLFQANLYLQDRHSHLTGYGKHKRVLVSYDPMEQTIVARVDAVMGDEDLPWPSPDQVTAVVMNPHHRLHPRGMRLVALGIHRDEKAPNVELGHVEPCRYYLFGLEEQGAFALHS